MNLKAPGHRVLIKPIDIVKKTNESVNIPGFKVVIPENEREYKVNTSEGEVVSIGPTAWMAYDYYKPNGERNPLWEPWCEVGDNIYYAKYGAKWITVDDVEYVLINDQDVQIVKDKIDE